MQELTEFNIEKATAKILMLKEQTAQNIIEIGKTLIEVKNNLEYGQFGEWLKNKVDYTHQTANKFMKIAVEFPDYAPVRNLGTRKLLALAGLEEEDRQELIKQNNIEDMTTKELEQAVKEKKEIKKQLEAEQEYSEELQEAIRQKEKLINELQSRIDSIQIPKKEIVEKEVVKEVIPTGIKEQIEKLKEEKNKLLNERNQYYEKAKEVERDLKEVKLTLKSEQTDGYRYQEVSEIGKDVKYFLDKCSKYTYFEQEYRKLSWQHKKIVEDAVKKVDVWVKKMKEALQSEREASEDLIYGEGEIIDG